MTNSYVLTVDAHRDLEEISAHTLERWGARQRERYLTQLFEGFDALADNPLIGKVRDDVHAGARSFPIARHVVFYAHQGERLTILRVLHYRRDPDRAFERSK